MLGAGLDEAPHSFICIASKDEPAGIPDDFFLLRALSRRGVQYKYVLWTDELFDESGHQARQEQQQQQQQPQQQQAVIRSLWEGRSRKGSSPELLQFFACMTEQFPHMANEYQLLNWTTHKGYLLCLEAAGVRVVPSCVIPASVEDKRGGTSWPSPSRGLGRQPIIESSPGGVKRLMVAMEWSEAVLKPAVGTRFEGVMRLSLSGWTLKVAFRVASMLKEGDCVLQPFLRPLLSFPALPSLLGEVCVVCIDGEVSHAIHKNPLLWGWHEETCACSGAAAELHQATCTCISNCWSQHNTLHCNISISPTRVKPEGSGEKILPAEVLTLLGRAPVEVVELPLPTVMMEAVQRVMDAIREKSDGRSPVLCRLDFLPRRLWPHHSSIDKPADHEEVDWLLSEVEGQWCEGFFRAAPDNTADLLLHALKAQ